MQKAFATALLAAMTTALQIQARSAESTLQCGSGQQQAAKAFFMGDEFKTWTAAQAECVSRGAVLAVPENLAENDMMFDVVAAHGVNPAWFGAYQRDNDRLGDWLNAADNELLPFTYWDAGQPQVNGEHCGMTQWSGKKEWHDGGCNGFRPFVCMTHCEAAAPVDPVVPVEACTMQYQALTDAKRTWHQAQEACVNLGAGYDLASVHSDTEAELLAQTKNEASLGNAWIGWHQPTKDAEFEWSDGSAAGWLNWNSGEPNDYNQEDCTHVGVGAGGMQWNDHQCTKTFDTLCGKCVSAVVEEPTSDDDNDVVDPTAVFDDGKFFVITDAAPHSRMTHANAANACMERGGFLAAVQSAEDQAAVAELAAQHGKKKYWLGGDEIASEGTWRWQDQTAEWGFSNFHDGQPNNWSGFEQECLVMKKKTGYEWHDNVCDKRRWAVCRYFEEGHNVNTPY